MNFWYLILALIISVVAAYLPAAVAAFVNNRNNDGHLDIRFRQLAAMRWVILAFIWIAPAAMWNAPLTFDWRGPEINWITVAGIYVIIAAATLLGARWTLGRKRILQPRFGIQTAMCVGMTAAAVLFCYSLQMRIDRQESILRRAFSTLKLDYRNPEATVVEQRFLAGLKAWEFKVHRLHHASWTARAYSHSNRLLAEEGFWFNANESIFYKDGNFVAGGIPLYRLSIPDSLSQTKGVINLQNLDSTSVDYRKENLPGTPVFAIYLQNNASGRPPEIMDYNAFKNSIDEDISWHVVFYMRE